MEKITTTLRIPKDIYEKIQDRTTTNDLSVNETMVRMLQFALVSSGQPIKRIITEEWRV